MRNNFRRGKNAQTVDTLQRVNRSAAFQAAKKNPPSKSAGEIFFGLLQLKYQRLALMSAKSFEYGVTPVKLLIAASMPFALMKS